MNATVIVESDSDGNSDCSESEGAVIVAHSSATWESRRCLRYLNPSSVPPTDNLVPHAASVPGTALATRNRRNANRRALSMWLKSGPM